jgi:N-acetylmuramoyl-L-alanine amidase
MLRTSLPSGFASRPVGVSLLLAALSACASGGGSPIAVPAAAPVWPAIPRVEGPMAIRVQYPSPNALIAARDSTFLLGTVNHGGASLRINGETVAVRPNGAFLAWVAMPPRSRAQFDLVAVLPGGERRELTLPIRLPAERRAVDGARPPYVDTTTVTPRAGLALRDDEPVRVSARLAAGARAEFRAAPCRGAAAPAALSLLSAENGDVAGREVPARLLRCGGVLAVVGRGDTVTYERPLPVVANGDSLGLVRVGTPAVADTDAVVIARPVPGGTYKWFLLPGTVLQATGRQGAEVRVRLDAALEVWVDAAQVTKLPAGSAAPRRVSANARLVPDSGYVDLVIPMGARPAYRVEAEGRTLRLTLHGVTGNSDIISFQQADSLVHDVQWTNEASDRAVYTVQLQRDVYGWLAFWRGDAFVLRLRRPPVIDAVSPLRGLTIAIDPGHPPAGSTGPTGLYEGVATLAVGERVQRLLLARGAVPFLTRTVADAVDLGQRPIMARRANAQAFVSIHLNAKPDGVNPYRNNGSGTYYFQPTAAALARAIQERLLVRLGLSNEGTWFDNLAVVRGTWMPGVLVEGAYVIVPEQEAALRTPEFQDAYALAIVEGLEAWFRRLATGAGARP